MLLRLYSPADMDLIALRNYYKRDFAKQIRDCLSSLLAGQLSYKMKLPMDLEKYYSPSNTAVIVNIYLNPKSDGPVIEYLNSIPRLYRGSMIKNLLRGSYSAFPFSMMLTAFFTSEKDVSDAKSTAAVPAPQECSSSQPPKAASSVHSKQDCTLPSSGKAKNPGKDQKNRNKNVVKSHGPKRDIPVATPKPPSDDSNAFDLFSTMVTF